MAMCKAAALLTVVLVGMTYAAYLWLHKTYTGGVDFNFSAICLAIAAMVITLGAASFVLRRMSRWK